MSLLLKNHMFSTCSRIRPTYFKKQKNWQLDFSLHPSPSTTTIERHVPTNIRIQLAPLCDVHYCLISRQRMSYTNSYEHMCHTLPFIFWNILNGFLPRDADETTEVILLIRLLALVVQIFPLKVTLDALCK